MRLFRKNDDVVYEYEVPATDAEVAEAVARSRRALAKTPEARAAANAVTNEKYHRALLIEFELRLAREALTGSAQFN